MSFYRIFFPLFFWDTQTWWTEMWRNFLSLSIYEYMPRQPMVLTLDSNSEYVAHTWGKIGLFNLIKCLKQIKYQRLLLTPISELPTNISTMNSPLNLICSISFAPMLNRFLCKVLNFKRFSSYTALNSTVCWFSNFVSVPF